MWIDETKTFWTNGVPITFHEIVDWYENYCRTVPKSIRKIQDPHFDEKTCYDIAKMIVREMEKKIGSAFGYAISTEPNIMPVGNTMTSFVESKSDIDWFDHTQVINKAMKDLEDKWRIKRETEYKRKQESIDFWKQNSTKPKPPSKPKPVHVFDWRKVLGFGMHDIINEETIKKHYRKEAIKRHPDTGGSNELIRELFRARDDAYKFIGKEPP